MPSKSRYLARLINGEGEIIQSRIDSDSLGVSVNKSAIAISGATVVSSADTLPSSPADGDQALVTSTSRFYIASNGGWYNVALINATPYWITEPSTTYNISNSGAQTNIEILASDSDGVSVSYVATTNTAFDDAFTIVKDSDNGRRFTVYIDSDQAATASGTVTFTATDGVNSVAKVSTFSVSFGTDWATATLTETIRRDSVTGLADGDRMGYMSGELSGDGLYFGVGAQRDTGPGAEDDAGGAHIFYYNGSSWDQSTKITVPSDDAEAYGHFGSAVSLNDDGSIAAIGHGRYSTQRGGFHIYTRSGSGAGTWTEQGVFAPSSAGSYALVTGSFEGYYGGPKISGNGSYVIVGRRTAPPSSTGAAYIFTGSGSSWTEQATLTRTGGATSDMFGQSVDINKTGEYAVVGADRAGGNPAGYACVFLRTGTSWAQQAELTPSDGASGDRFGHDVCISGDGLYVAVTAFEDDESYAGSGSVYVFVRSGSSWSQQAKIHLGAAGAAGAHFGQAIDINDDGDLLVITDGGNNTNTVGTLYIYERSGTSWSKIKELQASDAGDGDTPAGAAAQYYGFGSHCSISGNGNVVAGTAHPADHTDYRGAVYIWNG